MGVITVSGAPDRGECDGTVHSASTADSVAELFDLYGLVG